MAQFYTDFSEYATGSPPSDWTFSGPNFTQNIMESGGENILRLGSGSNRTDRRSSWDEPGSANDVEVLMRTRTDTKSDDGRLTAAVRIDLSTGHWYRVDGQSSNNFRLAVLGSGGFSVLGNESRSWSANVYYWIRLRASGTDIKLKIWTDGDAEPGAWDIETTDSTLASGWAGQILFEEDCFTDIAEFGVGTNGDTAPNGPVSAGPTGPFARGPNGGLFRTASGILRPA